MLQLVIGIIISTLLVISCANKPLTSADALKDQAKVIYVEQLQEKGQESDFTNMLINEFASVRDPKRIDLDECIKVANSSQDARIARRCYELSLSVQDSIKQIEIARAWVNIDRQNNFAYQILAQSYITNKQYDEGFDTLLEAKQLGIDVDVATIASNSIFLYGEKLDELISRYSNARLQYPQDEGLLLGEIILQTRRSEHKYYIGKYREALISLEALISFDTNQPINGNDISFERPYLFQSKSLEQLGRSQEAITNLEQAIIRHPNYTVLYLELIELYLANNAQHKAESTANKLLDLNNSDGVFYETGLVIARYSLDKVYKKIERHFLEISKNKLVSSELRELSLLRLSVLADLADQQQKRRTYLASIEKTPSLIVTATTELASIITEQQNMKVAEAYFEQARRRWPQLVDSLWQAQAQWLSTIDRNKAIALLDKLIEKMPSESLLFTRGMFYALNENIDAMEKDFKKILANNPTHVDTLNAYGYTLVDITDRIDEGSRMINRAFALNSERPAIVDSLGWSYFRQGKLQQALVLIHWAYSHLQDGEIGAHYVEILWNLGHTNEAKLLLNQELKREPDNTVLINTYQRLFSTSIK